MLVQKFIEVASIAVLQNQVHDIRRLQRKLTRVKSLTVLLSSIAGVSRGIAYVDGVVEAEDVGVIDALEDLPLLEGSRRGRASRVAGGRSPSPRRARQ